MKKVLKDWFGFDDFRPNQEEICAALVKGRDVFAVLPTGAGKSLCYMLPALMRNGLTVVVSPLISLMQDQVRSALEKGIHAEFINYTLSSNDTLRVYSQLRSTRLLYVSPERLLVQSFQQRLGHVRVGAFVVDEAHCLTEWGAEFRPTYLQMMGVINRYRPGIPVAGFTATATLSSQEDIISRLELINPLRVRASFNRPNLRYDVKRKDDEMEIRQIVDYAETTPGDGIIYRTTRYQVDDTVRKLTRYGIDCRPYHAGLSTVDREKNQSSFLRGETRVVVATIAFGMGIDKPDVRWVLHADIPKNLESYYQETGRAGRDGKPACCTLLFSKRDIPVTRGFIDRTENQDQRARSYKQFLEVLAFASGKVCRRKQLLKYFDEIFTGKCEGCDVCG